MSAIRIEVAPTLDGQGEWEEFTWDLFPLVPAEATMHLQRDGLPKIGVFVPAGGILIGKIGKSKFFRADKMPTALELQGLEFSELKTKFGSMWYDASCYATAETAGTVAQACFETRNDHPVAVVIVSPGVGPAPPSAGGAVALSSVATEKASIGVVSS